MKNVILIIFMICWAKLNREYVNALGGGINSAGEYNIIDSPSTEDPRCIQDKQYSTCVIIITIITFITILLIIVVIIVIFIIIVIIVILIVILIVIIIVTISVCVCVSQMSSEHIHDQSCVPDMIVVYV